MFFDRVALVNLDKRKDRLGAFKAKITPYPCLHDYIRYRAIHGDTVTVPSFYISGGGAYGCRQSHLRILEDALQDEINVLCVLEDDVRFVPNFELKLREFLQAVPDDWEGLMLGGQNHAEPEKTGTVGIFRSVDTQRTHAYVVRGKKPLQELYRLWARCDRHIDHWFGQWQQRHQVYQPETFLCGQDAGASDISGRLDTVRYWSPPAGDLKTCPLTVLVSDRHVAETIRNLGFHFGYDRDGLTGRDNGLTALESLGWPLDRMTHWANLIVAEALERGDIPGVWHVPTPDAGLLETKFGRPVRMVEARTVDDAVLRIPGLLPAWRARNTIWCWVGGGSEMLEGLAYHGWHRGRWKDDVTGLDQGIRKVVELGKYPSIKPLVKQLLNEAEDIRYGKVLLAHPKLNVLSVKEELTTYDVQELHGETLQELIDDSQRIINAGIEMYRTKDVME
jgi:hypothetical protein